jgi:predicted ATPase
MFTLKLENFRSFLNEEFAFSRINILIGENSSGKSSILKFLLALKQSLQVPVNRELNINLRGEFTDLGSYKDTIYYNDEDKPLVFSFSLSEEYYQFFLKQFTDDYYEDDEFESDDVESDIVEKVLKKTESLIDGPIQGNTILEYSLTKELDKHNTIRTSIKNDTFGELQIVHIEDDSSNDKQLIFGPQCLLLYTDYNTNTVLSLTDVEYEKQGFMTIIVGGSLRRSIAEYLKEAGLKPKQLKPMLEKYYHRIAFLLMTQNYVRSAINKMEYFNPLLTKPSRIYLARDRRRQIIINDIEDVVDYLSSNTPESNAVLEDLNNILSQFGITEGLEIIQDNRMLVKELRVKIKDLVSNIFDVGYGVALQIPLILKALLAERTRARKNSVLLIEQPEVHLHPRLHALLIEVFLSLGNSTTYFIETHSEHIIRKLQVLVKNKTFGLVPSDVSIHYLTRKLECSSVTKHDILPNGLLKPNFPTGFFDASYNLSKELLD